MTALSLVRDVGKVLQSPDFTSGYQRRRDVGEELFMSGESLKRAGMMLRICFTPEQAAEATALAERAADAAHLALDMLATPDAALDSIDAHTAWLGGRLVNLPTGRCSRCHENTGTFVDAEQGTPVSECCAAPLIDEGSETDAVTP